MQGSDANHSGAGSLTFAPASGQTQTVSNAIADQTGSGGSGGNAGAWGLAKSGAGTTTLSGTNTYTGATTVSAGTLAVNGSITSPTTVGANATLAGTGTTSANSVTVNSGGTLAPGNSVGTLATGSATLSSSSHYAVEIDSGGADRTNATGTANLGGSTLDLSLLGSYVHSPGTSYTIVHATGGVSGLFAGLPNGATVTSGRRPVHDRLQRHRRHADGDQGEPEPRHQRFGGHRPRRLGPRHRHALRRLQPPAARSPSSSTAPATQAARDRPSSPRPKTVSGNGQLRVRRLHPDPGRHLPLDRLLLAATPTTTRPRAACKPPTSR